ncbi:MAG: radical SAM family heme chaperone HemW [Bacteroidetes bacterium]|nr:radical SAM family heme chaperone HemW [Fibrella sp.]
MHLYLHIPFCKQACHYCDFHFSTNQRPKADLVTAMAHEIGLRASYLPPQPLETIYFGGGTPSLLTESELAELFGAIHRHFTVDPGAEVTLEANPDDLTAEKLVMLRRYVNRLSIGIQTFDEATLRWMNRAHSATEAVHCVHLARAAGFDELSIDLIYGIPGHARPNGDASLWTADLDRALALNVPHISAYALTIEPNTAFSTWTKTGKLPPVDEDLAAAHFEQLVEALTASGYEQYEISSFARPAPGQIPHYARHNTAYWQQRPYLGVGPAAHSYDGQSRQFNVANNAQYITALRGDVIPAERGELTSADRVNEYLLTGLRTKWGCQLAELNRLLDDDFLTRNQAELTHLQPTGWLASENGVLRLTDSGKLFADRVASELFV